MTPLFVAKLWSPIISSFRPIHPTASWDWIHLISSTYLRPIYALHPYPFFLAPSHVPFQDLLSLSTPLASSIPPSSLEVNEHPPQTFPSVKVLWYASIHLTYMRTILNLLPLDDQLLISQCILIFLLLKLLIIRCPDFLHSHLVFHHLLDLLLLPLLNLLQRLFLLLN